MASPGNQHCANCIGTLSFPTSILRLSCRNANSITNTHFAQCKRSIAVRNKPHRYVNSPAIWDHTALPATRQRWHSRLYPQPKPVLD